MPTQLRAAQSLVAAALRRQPRRAHRDATPTTRTARPGGITGLTTADGRFTILMPHPERVFRTVQMSWHPRRVGRGLAVDADVPQRPRAVG